MKRRPSARREVHRRGYEDGRRRQGRAGGAAKTAVVTVPVAWLSPLPVGPRRQSALARQSPQGSRPFSLPPPPPGYPCPPTPERYSAGAWLIGTPCAGGSADCRSEEVCGHTHKGKAATHTQHRQSPYNSCPWAHTRIACSPYPSCCPLHCGQATAHPSTPLCPVLNHFMGLKPFGQSFWMIVGATQCSMQLSNGVLLIDALTALSMQLFQHLACCVHCFWRICILVLEKIWQTSFIWYSSLLVCMSVLWTAISKST